MLDAFQSLLTSIAMGETLNRERAFTYSTMRAELLQSSSSHLLPGFVHQCISLYKFREFIMLYDGRAAERCRFILEAFEHGGSSLAPSMYSREPDARTLASKVF